MTKGKRKKSKSPTPTSSIEVKKPKQISNDEEKIQLISKTLIPQPDGNVATSASQTPVYKKAKPVFVEESLQFVRELLASIKFTKWPLCKIHGAKSTQVSCYSADDKNMLINKLKCKSIGYHTFTEPFEKHPCFVLKGFYITSCKEMLDILQSIGVPAINVSDLIRKEDFIIYKVHFSDNISLETLNESHHTIDHIVVNWENLKRPDNKVTQCFNCQRFGHSSFGCGYTSRCVKCELPHPRGQCTRTTREGNPKCCNCGGDHAANHRGCSVYQKIIERKTLRSNKPVNLPTPEQFPQLTKDGKTISGRQEKVKANSSKVTNQVSYAEKLQESSKNERLFKSFTDAQDRLSKIQDIEKTIKDFCNLVDELTTAPNEKSARLQILLKYTNIQEEKDEKMEDDEEEDGIKENEDGLYTKWKRSKGVTWFTFGKIEDLTECEKNKMTKHCKYLE